jgi:Sulfatase
MTQAADPRPNILIVFSDQQRWDTLGVNGSPMGLTPHLDRLAREGPAQHVNLLGRDRYREVAQGLRERLVARMVAAGEAAPEVRPFEGSMAP